MVEEKLKIVRITTVPLSLEKLLEGQLRYMSEFFDIVAVSSDKKRLEAFGEKEGVNTFHLHMTRRITPLRDMLAVWKLYKFLKREKPQIVHSHTPKAGIVGMAAGYLAGVKIRVHTVAGLPLMEARGFKRILLKRVEKLTYSCATHVWPNSKGLYDYILRKKLCSKHKLDMVGEGSSNGIDTSHFDPSEVNKSGTLELRNELGIQTGDFVFLFVGRLTRDKGINELVEAYTNLDVPGSSTKLLLVGPMEPELDPLSENTIEAIKADKSILPTGYKEDVRQYFAVSDALVFPSYREGFPNVVMQAAAMGLPVIATDINGCNEIISERVNGLLIEPKNAEALKRSMRRLLDDQSLFDTLKSNARQSIAGQFERSTYWKLLKEKYDLLLSKAHTDN